MSHISSRNGRSPLVVEKDRSLEAFIVISHGSRIWHRVLVIPVPAEAVHAHRCAARL